MLEKQFEELKLTGNLPSPTGVGLALLQSAQRPEISIEEVAAIVQADPTLTGRVLKIANSAAQGAARPATTIQEAALRLGLHAVHAIGLSFSLLAGNRGGRCRAFDYDEYWSHSLATAVACQALARHTRSAEPGEAFTCGLLSGIGRLALASVHPSTYGEVLERARGQSSARLAEVETELLGTNHREMAGAMLRDWNLPAAFSEAVVQAGGGRRAEDLANPAGAALAGLLQGGRDLARAMTIPREADAAACRQRLGELAQLCQRLRLDMPAFTRLWLRCVEDWQQWGETMGVPAQVQLPLDEVRARAVQTERQPADVETPAAAAAGSAPLSDAAAATGLRILLVDDDVATCGLLADQLRRDRHGVLVAATVEEALVLALEQAPHVLVTQWKLPGKSGLDLVRTLRRSAMGERLHVILMAGREEEPRILEAFESGVDEYLSKPCDPRVLQARVHAAQRVVQLNERVEGLLREREAQLGELAIATRRLKTATVTDPLTSLFNRRFAMEELEKARQTALSSHKPLAVIMVDIDLFKSVNDEHGHDVGDIVLREVAHVLRGSLRRGDLPCRIGGEEFLVLCPNTDLARASLVAERLRERTREHVIQVGGLGRAVTLSLGVAELDPADPSIDALVKRADVNVYLAKQAGRDRVVAEPAPSARERLAG